MQRVGMARAKACITLFSDRGKQCTNSAQCLGDCRYFDDSKPPAPGMAGEYPTINDGPPPGTKVIGRCQWSNDDFGCRAEVVDGILQAAECID